MFRLPLPFIFCYETKLTTRSFPNVAARLTTGTCSIHARYRDKRASLPNLHCVTFPTRTQPSMPIHEQLLAWGKFTSKPNNYPFYHARRHLAQRSLQTRRPVREASTGEGKDNRHHTCAPLEQQTNVSNTLSCRCPPPSTCVMLS